MVSISVTIQSNKLPTIAAGMKPKARALVGRTGFDVVAGCKVRSRVDTGAMRNGWGWRWTGETEGEVFNPVEYTIYNEYPVQGRPAQPMAHPAADAARPGFEAGARQIVEGL